MPAFGQTRSPRAGMSNDDGEMIFSRDETAGLGVVADPRPDRSSPQNARRQSARRATPRGSRARAYLLSSGAFLIFYTVADGGIAVMRVLHGARDHPRE